MSPDHDGSGMRIPGPSSIKRQSSNKIRNINPKPRLPKNQNFYVMGETVLLQFTCPSPSQSSSPLPSYPQALNPMDPDAGQQSLQTFTESLSTLRHQEERPRQHGWWESLAEQSCARLTYRPKWGPWDGRQAKRWSPEIIGKGLGLYEWVCGGLTSIYPWFHSSWASGFSPQ